MTTFYMDPVGGNDANDGLSFANRKRTFNSVTTACAENDTVRVIASPDPFSVGTATWTDNSINVDWSNSSNLLVDGCDSGWTGVTNVTVSHPSDSRSKTGTSYVRCAIATAFTTGKIAYKTLPAALNVSAFQQIAMYFKVSTISSTTMNFKIALCSDTTGNTIVAEMNQVLVSNVGVLEADTWVGVMLDYGASFPATSINSIAIYLNADPSTSGIRDFDFDGFVCCKAPGAADLIDIYSLIGKNTGGEPEWYAITDLSQNGVKISSCRRTLLSGFTLGRRTYRGVSEAVTAYIRNPLKLASPWADTDAAIKRKNITIEGGWNRTDMSTKTGETWLCGVQLYPGINGDSTLRTDVNILNLGFTACTTGAKNLIIGQGAVPTTSHYNFLGFIHCDTPVTYLNTGNNNRPSGYYRFTCKQVWGSTYPLTTPNRPGEFNVTRIHGCTHSGNNNTAWVPGFSHPTNPAQYTIGKIDNNGAAILLDSVNQEVRLKLSGTVLENNGSNFTFFHSTAPRPIDLHFDNMEDLLIDEYLDSLSLLNSLNNRPTTVIQTRIGGDSLKNRTVLHGQLFFESSQAIRHTASGHSWRFYLPNWFNFNEDRPAGAPGFPLGYAAVEAGKEVTVTCWLYSEYDVYYYYGDTQANPAGIYGIMVQPDPALGLSKVQVTADMTIVGAWQQLTLTFTPSASGVVRIDAFAYGNLNQDYLDPPAIFSTYYDDLEVTQEP